MVSCEVTGCGEALMRRAVVSGITGHLGCELARQLIAAGVEVHGLTRQDIALITPCDPPPRLHRIDGGSEGIIAMFNDIRPDAVFHLAAVARREHETGDLGPFVEANVLFGTQLLKAMK